MSFDRCAMGRHRSVSYPNRIGHYPGPFVEAVLWNVLCGWIIPPFYRNAVVEHTRFSVCGCVKRDCDMSVRGHGSLRGHDHRVCPRLMMVFGGGSSPMSFADCVAVAASQPFLRDQSTSVPLGHRFPPVRRESISGSGLLCPLIVSLRRRPWARRIDQRGLGAAFGLRGFGAHFLARRSKLSRMRPISASSGSNCPPYHSSIWPCSSCLGSAMASRKSA